MELQKLWQGCGIAFIVPFTIIIIVTCETNNQKVIQVKVEPHNPPIGLTSVAI
jgi:hypothetical protein